MQLWTHVWPMRRLMQRSVLPTGASVSRAMALLPTTYSSLSGWKRTTDGVVRPRSCLFLRILTWLRSTCHMPTPTAERPRQYQRESERERHSIGSRGAHELVVPRSMPMQMDPSAMRSLALPQLLYACSSILAQCDVVRGVDQGVYISQSPYGSRTHSSQSDSSETYKRLLIG